MPTITLAQLRSLAYDRVDNNTVLFPTAEVDSIINEAIRTLNLFTGFLQATADIPGFSVIGQRLYQCPSPILFPLKVQFEGRQLDMVPLRRLGEDYRKWATDVTAGAGPVSRWSPIGITQFVIHPADSVGGQYIGVTGVIEPPLRLVSSVPSTCNRATLLRVTPSNAVKATRKIIR